MVDAFVAAARGGDFNALVGVLDPDAVLRIDRGGEGPDALTVIRGAHATAKRATLIRGVAGLIVRPALVNGAAGTVSWLPDGRPRDEVFDKRSSTALPRLPATWGRRSVQSMERLLGVRA